MRKIQQSKILDTLQTLENALSEVTQLLINNESSSAIQILSGCQELTASVLDFVEDIEGKGTTTATLLEEYYRILYEVSLKINTKNDITLHTKHLKEWLFDIDVSVRNELRPNKIEVAFLPYKASMWDSLESIWLTAKDDPQCDAYVIPIPYYEKLPNGDLGNLRCEADLYPDYVPIVDWKTYNVEERHPDIIFFHNPYDNANHVLGVYPDFHSKRLRQLTNLLVYVPYFVSTDDVSDSFVILPGTIYSDITFVQSERVRRKYIQSFEQFEKENNCIGAFGNLKYKFIAIGSPKFDKVISSKPEDFNIPDSWRRLIENPNGTKKKIVLYNTTVTSILRGNEPYLKKIPIVLNMFRDMEDVVLWWRPHPMNDATFQSMRPHLLNEYINITEKYKKDGWGIYDETADLHRAISLSDLYYGDAASVQALYLCSGKPLIMRDFNVLQDCVKFRDHALFGNIYDDGSDIWFTEHRFNALFKMNKKTWMPEYLGSFPGELRNTLLQGQIVEINTKLFFAPLRAYEIAIYDKVNSTFEKIPLIDNFKYQTPQQAFHGAVRHEDDIYFIPFMYPGILRLNTVTNEISIYSDWIGQLGNMTIDLPCMYFSLPITTDEHTFMIASCHTNAVISFDMNSNTSMIYKVGAASYRYNGICFDGENYWLSPVHDAPVIKWNPKKGIFKEFVDFPFELLGTQNRFHPIIYCGGHVWLLPKNTDTAIKINVLTDEISIAEEFQPKPYDKINAMSENAYYFSQSCGDVIYAYSGYTAEFIQYNTKTMEFMRRPIIISKDIIQNVESSMLSKYIDKTVDNRSVDDLCIRENGFFTIPCLFNLLLHKIKPEELSSVRNKQFEAFRSKSFKDNETNLDGSSGKAIYAYCKRIIEMEFNIEKDGY